MPQDVMVLGQHTCEQIIPAAHSTRSHKLAAHEWIEVCNRQQAAMVCWHEPWNTCCGAWLCYAQVQLAWHEWMPFRDGCNALIHSNTADQDAARHYVQMNCAPTQAGTNLMTSPKISPAPGISEFRSTPWNRRFDEKSDISGEKLKGPTWNKQCWDCSPPRVQACQLSWHAWPFALLACWNRSLPHCPHKGRSHLQHWFNIIEMKTTQINVL